MTSSNPNGLQRHLLCLTLRHIGEPTLYRNVPTRQVRALGKAVKHESFVYGMTLTRQHHMTSISDNATTRDEQRFSSPPRAERWSEGAARERVRAGAGAGTGTGAGTGQELAYG
jgi:hypothetical protein